MITTLTHQGGRKYPQGGMGQAGVVLGLSLNALGQGAAPPIPPPVVDADGGYWEEERRRRMIRFEEDELVTMAGLIVPFLDD